MLLKDLCFEIIEKCPNECLFCSSKSCIDGKNKISLEDFKRVIDYFMNNGGIEELSLSGGEPLLHPDIFEIIKYAKEYGIRVVLFTSGIKLSEEISKEELKYITDEMNKTIEEVKKNEPDNQFQIDIITRHYLRIIEPVKFAPISRETFKYLEILGLDKVVFDFQGYEADTDMYLMGRTNYMHNYLLDSISHAAETNIETDVHFVPMKPNYKQIPDLLELLDIRGIDNISILKFVPQGRGKNNIDNLELSDDEMKEFKQLLEKSEHLFKGTIRKGIPMLEDNNHKCNAGTTKIDIVSNGLILPCPAFKDITQEEAKKYGINLYTINELEKIKLVNTTRNTPLCQKVYSKKYL